ncbi:hypothetical protein SAMN04515671_3473 [Nakamurella panacisegetis]|uniref:Uncharacterized protein n=1 Tax=Nakamurella panacisegetis TaxID=1090615 RepID=A0A1H0RC03_9ACTN|nr:hypothetical protein [Nakamurella panacisegetis]SDP26566.1 hypothetical protein SAMN04515671_3473 [Nakamurella panacisegetis]
MEAVGVVDVAVVGRGVVLVELVVPVDDAIGDDVDVVGPVGGWVVAVAVAVVVAVELLDAAFAPKNRGWGGLGMEAGFGARTVVVVAGAGTEDAPAGRATGVRLVGAGPVVDGAAAAGSVCRTVDLMPAGPDGGRGPAVPLLATP